MAVRGYWSDKRFDGTPVEKGTVMWVIDDDDLNPIAIYGKSAQDVIDKLTLQQGYAQAELARRAATPVTVTPVTPRARATADTLAQATADLANPAKSGAAIVTLFQDATGVDPRRIIMDNFNQIAKAWQAANPGFYAHEGNKRLLVDQAKMLVGGDLSMVTATVLSQAYSVLRQRGELFERPAALPPNPNEPEPAASSSSKTITFPGESQVQRTERPRGAPFATGTRSTHFRASQTTPPRTSKYTAEYIRNMPQAEMDRLNEANDPEYIEACERIFGSQASA